MLFAATRGGIADLLVLLGAPVVLASRKLERVEAAAAEIAAAGGKASAVAVDVRNADLVRSVIGEVAAAQAGSISSSTMRRATSTRRPRRLPRTRWASTTTIVPKLAFAS